MHPSVPPRMGIGAILGVLFAGAALAPAQNLSLLGDYSVIVSGDFSTNSDVEGRTLVGGNLTGGNSANFGIRLQNQVPSSDLVLRVGGDIFSGNPLNLNAGSLELGGSNHGRIINYNGGGTLVPNPGVDYSIIIGELTAVSGLLSELDPNSNVLIPAGQPSAFKFEAAPDANGLAVFSINGSDLFGNPLVQQTELTANGATDIVINVYGNAIDWQHGNFVGLFNDSYWRERIVWNFLEADSINFGSKNMVGQILAPDASITASGVIDGSVFAKNLTTTSEVHLPGYNGNINVPEPATSFLGLLGATLLLLRRRRA